MMDSLRSDDGRPALRMKRVQSLEGAFTWDAKRSVEVRQGVDEAACSRLSGDRRELTWLDPPSFCTLGFGLMAGQPASKQAYAYGGRDLAESLPSLRAYLVA